MIAFSKFFPEFNGNIHNPDDCSDFLIEKFQGHVHSKKMYSYKICCLNSDVIERTIHSIFNYSIENNKNLID